MASTIGAAQVLDSLATYAWRSGAGWVTWPTMAEPVLA
jgi:hypothetical protein